MFKLRCIHYFLVMALAFIHTQQTMTVTSIDIMDSELPPSWMERMLEERFPYWVPN
ncbi:hypothetical protein OK016_09555 [Vibrio chagasii]|nr:hypothetical protein [Vibrio chagasii]